MTGKNLPFKFALVALLVALGLWSLHDKGLRQGIDLRGGHSLTFEFEVQEGENARMLRDQMLATLKRRVDPQGLRSLEWRPQGENRIEIRMPAGTEASSQAKEDYQRAIRRISNSNIQRSEIRAILLADPAQRDQKIAELIDRLAPGDPTRQSELRESIGSKLAELDQLDARMAEARTALREAEQRLAGTARTDPARDAALVARDEAYAAYEDLRRQFNRLEEEVLSYNIRISNLEGLLGLYVSQSEREALAERGEKGEQEIERRTARFEQGLSELKEAHPQRVEQIEQVVDVFKRWAEVRQLLDDPEDLKRLVAQAGVLTFRIAPYSPTTRHNFSISFEDRERYLEILQEEDVEQLAYRDDPLLWFPVARDQDPDRFGQLVLGERAGRTYVLLYNTANNMMLRGDWTVKANPTTDRMGGPAVGFEFDAAGARQFAALTALHKRGEGDQVGHALAVLLDGEVYSAPGIDEIISKRGIIRGDFTGDQVFFIVNILNSGSLPARLNPVPVNQSTFGPGLGAENRQRGIQAAYIGLAAVAVVMLVVYLRAGLVANAALMLNIVLLLGAMSLLNAVFTLPGIAGVILTIGIAVDANVLIFERLREEQQRGQSIKMALKNAYDRAFSAIFDANLTTLITCMILVWVGTEEVRGFGITLGLGVVFSMFSALLFTRWIFQFLLDRGWLTKPLHLVKILGVPNINWMAKRRVFWGVSIALVVIGLISLAGQGSDVLGIEFSAGTQAVIRLDDGALVDGELPNDGLIERKLKAAAEEINEGGSLDKFLATITVETRIVPTKVEDFFARYDTDGDGKVTAAEFQARAIEASDDYFAKVDADGDGNLTEQEVEDLPSMRYQVSTTESELGKVRDVIRKALGDTLSVQTSRTGFELVEGTDLGEPGRALQASLGVPLAADGTTWITPEVPDGAKPLIRDDLLNFEGGVLMVVRGIDPPMNEAELSQRIANMRLVEEYRPVQYVRTKVLGLTPSGNGFSAFAVLSHPGEDAGGAMAGTFAQMERDLLGDALRREQAIPAINFDPAIAGNTAQLAGVAIILSWLALVAYLWLRFGSFWWGVAAVICLIHDVLIVVGLIAASAWVSGTFFGNILGIESFKIDLAMVAALLTVIGYSVNDTIVVFDRIRENRGRLTEINMRVLNASVNQTLSRTVMTSLTTLVVVLVMYIWGGAGIHGFSFALLMGVLFGTYSSVAIASPLLLGFRKALLAEAKTAEPATS